MKKKDYLLEDSSFLNGLSYDEAIKLAMKKITEGGFGFSKINYRIRDAVFSRQRYWGEPFPIYYKDNIPFLLEDDQHVILPAVDEYLPTKSGEPPLARAQKKDWNVFQGERMEFNVMPGWAGSSWYFFKIYGSK